MKLERWDIVFLRLDDKDAVGHPAVVISSADILESTKRDRINVVMGTKKQPAEEARAHHVLLNGSDGLEFLTLLDCSFVYTARKTSILRWAGRVSAYRRQEIQKKTRAFLGLG